MRLGLRIVALALNALPVHATPGSRHVTAARSERARPELELELVGALGSDSELARLLDEWLSAQDISHAIVHAPPPTLAAITSAADSAPSVRIWLVPLDDRRIRLVLADAGARRYHLRELALASGLDEVGREHLAQVVLSSALAFKDQGLSTTLEDIDRALSEPSTPKPATDEAPRLAAGAPVSGTAPRFGFELGAGYVSVDEGPEGLAQGLGAIGDLGWSWRQARVGGFVRGEYRLLHQASGGGIALSIREPAASAGASAAFMLSRALSLRAELGAGAVFATVAPHAAAGSNVEPLVSRADVRPFARLALGPSFHFGRFWASALFDADWHLRATHYDIAIDGQRQTALRPWRVQPGLWLAIGFAAPAG